MVYNASFNDLYSSYRYRAKRKKLEFTLTKLEFYLLTSCACYYCGIEPNQVKDKRFSLLYYYNGIDRIDSSKGYHVENCISACFICNRSKGDMDFYEFLEWIERLTKNHSSNSQNRQIIDSSMALQSHEKLQIFARNDF